MSNEVLVNYVKISNLNRNGEEIDVNYAVHVFHDWDEVLLNHQYSFDMLKSTSHPKEILKMIETLEEKDFLEAIKKADDFYFNKEWIPLNELEGGNK